MWIEASLAILIAGLAVWLVYVLVRSNRLTAFRAYRMFGALVLIFWLALAPMIPLIFLDSLDDILPGHEPTARTYLKLLGLPLLYVAILVLVIRRLVRSSPGSNREAAVAHPGPEEPRTRTAQGESVVGRWIGWYIGLSICGLIGFSLIRVAFPPAGRSSDALELGTIVVSSGLFLALVAGVLWLLGRDSASMSSAPPSVKPPAEAAFAPQACPKCGCAIASGAPQGLCPRCLLQGAIPGESRPSPTLAFVEAYVPPPVEQVQQLFPHLQIVRLIGQGGMGAVYLARQTALDRLVALKLIRPHDDPTFTERFIREAKAMARLSHPNIVTIYESGEAGGLPYIVMEYVSGLTLRDAMRERKLTPAEALAIVPQICDALEYAHSQGVVHRDIKPENILLMGGEAAEAGPTTAPPRQRAIKIADFGLAKVADPVAISLTGTQQVMGTPHYMAPEQWEKPGEVDHRADLYALGVVLYELLTGELPLGRFELPSQKVRLDLRIDDVVLRALAKEPGSRYQHASEIRIALEAVRSGTDIPGWVRTPMFREYRSNRTFWGWPLVHITSGIDPRTGRTKTARGWIAIGDAYAVGGLALAGGFARGIVAIAGAGAFGVFALAGGFTIGFVALAGGAALGLLAAGAGGVAAAGGLAVAGGVAAAVKFSSAGGVAIGRWVWSSQRQDQDFVERIQTCLDFDFTGW